jgi:hypothetical protein
MMRCEEIQANLSSYYDGEVSPQVASRMEAHLQHCETCQGELKSIEEMSSMLVASSAGYSHCSCWSQIVSRLDQEPVTSIQETQGDTQGVWFRRNAGTRFVAAVALAAGVLLAVSLQQDWFAKTTPASISQMASMDISELSDLFAAEPDLAMATISRRFAGQKVEPSSAEQLLGYRPAATKFLPEDIHLVSTQVLKLPFCDCASGKCTCGSNGCNCSACMCQRDDGSQLLVIEHCESQKVSFGNQGVGFANAKPVELRLLGSGHGRAASWISADRRLTAIGLRDDSEAMLLAQALGRNDS